MLTHELLKQLETKHDDTYDHHTVIPVIYKNALYYIFDADPVSFAITSAAATLYGDDEEQLYEDDDILSYELADVSTDISHKDAERIVNQALLSTPRPCRTFKLFQEHELNYYIVSIIEVDVPDVR